MYGYIYKITDLTNGKCYIGQHKYDKPELDPKYKGSGIIIDKLWKKRPETLLMEYIMTCATLEELNYFETYFIEYMNTLHPNGYNLNTGGDCRKASEEAKRKQILGQTGGKRSEKTRRRISAALKGWVPSDETKELWSKIRKGKNTGENNPMYGVHRFGKDSPFYGKTHSAETRKRLREAHKGKHWYHNNLIEVKCETCPEGFVSGRLNKQK